MLVQNGKPSNRWIGDVSEIVCKSEFCVAFLVSCLQGGIVRSSRGAS